MNNSYIEDFKHNLLQVHITDKNRHNIEELQELLQQYDIIMSRGLVATLTGDDDAAYLVVSKFHITGWNKNPNVRYGQVIEQQDFLDAIKLDQENFQDIDLTELM